MDRENLVHLFYHSDLSLNPIFKIWVMRALSHVNSAKGKILFSVHSLFYLVITSVKPQIGFGFGLLYSGLVFVNELLQMSVSNQLVQENLKSPVAICSVSIFFMEKTPPPLVAPLGVSPHGFGFLEVGLISDTGEELMDWFFENHVNPLPYPLW